jgi:hypothetical protein
MYRGALILESLKTGTTLEQIPLLVHRVTRQSVDNASSAQPAVWSILEFEVEDAQAGTLADTLTEVLDEPGWYADFHNDHEIFVVFPGRVFRYPLDDRAGRAEAQAFGRSLGIPEPQLDWAEG